MRPLYQSFRVVYLRPCRHEPWMPRITNEPHGLPRNAEAALPFGADGHIFYVSAEGLRQERIEFVSAVVTDLMAKKT